MQARMTNPAKLVPEAMPAIQTLISAIKGGAAPESVLELAHLRTSQINGCSLCVEMGAQTARKAGESDERLFAIAAWRESPHFTDAERAALALTEHVTRISDSSDPVPDDVWAEAATHYDESALAALILMIATTNLFNRINVPVRQPAGEWM